MKLKTKQKWIHFVLLTVAVIALVEFQKFQKRRAPVCEDGACAVPAEYAAAKVLGPQSVPYDIFIKPATNPPAGEEP
jgi:hypothetical protein